jgi:hypothetical protein
MIDCLEVHRLADRFLALELERGAEAEVRAHLDGCASCREMLISLEPAQRVVGFGSAIRGDEDDRFVSEVMAGIHQRRLERTLGHRRRYLAVAAAILVAVLGATIAVRRLTPPAHTTVAQATAAAAPTAPARVARSAPAFVEVDRAGVRLYQLTADAGSNTPVQVAFIVDPNVEL